jgi:hypothetical protein
VYFNTLQSLGAIYTYRPWKLGYRSVHVNSNAHYAPNWFLILLGLFPVFVSAMGAFIIIWYAVPIGWNCRHVWVVVVTSVWVISAGITTWIHRDKIPKTPGKVTGHDPIEHLVKPGGGDNDTVFDIPVHETGGWSERTRWIVVLIKDACIGGAGLVLVFLSTSGIFNNCACWTDHMWHSILPGDWGRLAFVPLNTDPQYESRADLVYGPVVYACLGAQLAFFALVVFLWWDGISVVRWGETHRRREWRHEVARVGGDDGDEDVDDGDDDDDGQGRLRFMTYDDPSYLLFWYRRHEFEELDDIRARRQSEYDAKQEVISRRRSEALMRPLRPFRERNTEAKYEMVATD